MKTPVLPYAYHSKQAESFAAISARQVGLVLGTRQTLADLDFDVPRSSILALLGPNGAGKTTLLRILALGLEPSTGSLQIFGHDVRGLSPSERRALRRRIALVPQRSAFNAVVPLTGRDVIATGLLAGRRFWALLSRRERQLVEEMAQALEIASLLDRPYRVLSGGEQQKVHIARALIQGADLLLLDEPTSGLDLTWQRRLTDLIDHLCTSHHLTIVVTTHHPQHLPPSCRQGLLLSRGRVAFSGDPHAEDFRRAAAELFGDESESLVESLEPVGAP